MKKLLVLFICGIVASTAFAQDNISKNRWYIQGLVGANNTGHENMGIGTFKHNIGFTGGVELGYEFNPYIGLGFQTQYNRLHLQDNTGDRHGFNSIEPSLNVYWNLTNTFLGYKFNRKNALRLYAGFAAAFSSDLQDGYYFGDGRDNNSVIGFRGGIQYERALGTKGWGFVIDAGINSFNDRLESYNEFKKLDSHLNLQIGIRKYFGGPYRKHRSDFKETIVNYIEKHDTVTVKNIVEKVVPKDVYSIFFDIDQTVIRDSETPKIKAVADFMKAHPEKVVFVFGYADKNTGTTQRNAWLAKNRASVICEQLTGTYGIDSSRIISYDQGDKVQPYTEEEFEKNRAVICVITDIIR